MKKKLLAICLVLLMVFTFAACGPDKENGVSAELTSYEEALEAAKGTTVTFYGWGGDEVLNKWTDQSLAKTLKDEYDITLERVPMNIEDILAQLSDEKQAGEEKGSIDMIWINGENFYSAKDNGLLYGPFTSLLPNMDKYVDMEDPETENDFCTPIEGYEAPYSKAQLVMITDTAKIETNAIPTDAKSFMGFCKKYPGKVTYPALPDFTGSAFVRNLVYELCGGYEQFTDMKADKETVKNAIQPAIDYLKELNPYLWKEGKTFPASSTEVQNMFAEGELVFHVSYTAYDVAQGIENGTYTDTTTSFQFDKGTIGNTNYIAIANNAPNKAGAIVAINEVLSAKMQQTKFELTKYIPVVGYNKLSDKEVKAFERVDIGKGSISSEELLSKRLPEMPANLVPIIEEIWLEEVVGK